MTHELKIWPMYYCRVADGSKTYEVRDNDRGFQPGDTVILREYDPEPAQLADKSVPKGYTNSPNLKFKIGYMLSLKTSTGDKVVFSLLPAQAEKKGSKK